MRRRTVYHYQQAEDGSVWGTPMRPQTARMVRAYTSETTPRTRNIFAKAVFWFFAVFSIGYGIATVVLAFTNPLLAVLTACAATILFLVGWWLEAKLRLN